MEWLDGWVGQKVASDSTSLLKMEVIRRGIHVTPPGELGFRSQNFNCAFSTPNRVFKIKLKSRALGGDIMRCPVMTQDACQFSGAV